MAVLDKVVQCDYRRTQDVVVTSEHLKRRMSYVAGFGNTVFEILYESVANGQM